MDCLRVFPDHWCVAGEPGNRVSKPVVRPGAAGVVLRYPGLFRLLAGSQAGFGPAVRTRFSTLALRHLASENAMVASLPPSQRGADGPSDRV